MIPARPSELDLDIGELVDEEPCEASLKPTM
jgi:hypothetical protein